VRKFFKPIHVRLTHLRYRYRRWVYQFRMRLASIGRRMRYGYSNLPWKQPRDTAHAKNNWTLYLDVAWWGVASGVWGTYLSVFAVRLGASTEWLGVLAALPALVNMLFSIPSARIIERQPRRLPLVVRVGFLQRLAWLGVALVPLILMDQPAVVAIVAIAGLTTIPAATSNVAFTNLLADLVPPGDRARVVSIRSVLLSVTTTATVMACGAILDGIPFPLNYQLVFGAAFACAMVSLYYVSRLQVPHEVTVVHRERPKHWITVSIRNAIAEVRAEKAFVKYAVSSLIFHWGIFFPTALYSIYRVRNLGASNTWIGLLTMVDSLVTIVSYLVWGRIVPRWGNRKVLVVTAFGMIFFPVLTALSTSLPLLLIPALIAGVFTPGFNLASFNELLAVSPETNRPRFIGIYTSVVNAPAFLAPLAGSYMATVLDIRLAMYFGGVFRFLGGLAFLLMLGGWAKRAAARR